MWICNCEAYKRIILTIEGLKVQTENTPLPSEWKQGSVNWKEVASLYPCLLRDACGRKEKKKRLRVCDWNRCHDNVEIPDAPVGLGTQLPIESFGIRGKAAALCGSQKFKAPRFHASFLLFLFFLLALHSEYGNALHWLYVWAHVASKWLQIFNVPVFFQLHRISLVPSRHSWPHHHLATKHLKHLLISLLTQHSFLLRPYLHRNS